MSSHVAFILAQVRDTGVDDGGGWGWWWFWLAFIVLLIVLPLGYGSGYRRWGWPDPRRRRSAAPPRGEEPDAGVADTGGWGALAALVWVFFVIAVIWLIVAWAV